MTPRKCFLFLTAACWLVVLALVSLAGLGCGNNAGDLGPSDTASGPGKAGAGAPLTVAYSDWPGWLVWEIGVQKGFFKDAGVNVNFVWFEYGPSIDAFAAGKVDAVCIVCGDSLVTGAQGKPSTAIVLTDYSNGNDKIIGKPGVESIKDLKGKKAGLEQNLVENILLDKALEENGLAEADVQIVNVATNETPQTLASGGVDAIGAWYPISGQTLTQVAGSKALYTSANAPGLIYDALQVSRESLASRRDEWKKVVGVWFQCLDFLNDPKTHNEAVGLMAARINAKPEDLAQNLKGTFLLDGPGNLKALTKGETLESVYGSIQHADGFYRKHAVYQNSQDLDSYVDPSLVKEVLKK
jgi:NitT/TauT family transport system substrate-binding protein